MGFNKIFDNAKKKAVDSYLNSDKINQMILKYDEKLAKVGFSKKQRNKLWNNFAEHAINYANKLKNDD